MMAAAYCRVSTDRGEQANSFSAQQRYFSEYLQRHDQWHLYRVYADEGISGTSTKNRIQFHAMIRDAEAGCFQVILTKEVSRFSRNILDTIAYTRKLRALGVRVIFLQDGIDTMEPDAELRLSIMGTIAQEESRKTSTRVKWGQTRQMERGVVFGRSLLGYEVKNGRIYEQPLEAELVQRIFVCYTEEQMSASQIAAKLEQEGQKTCRGGTHWSAGYIGKILKNEKYVGDLVQKKTCTPDYLTHQKKYNHGLEDKIILNNHHTPIITRELWDKTQSELHRRNRRSGQGNGCSVQYACSGKIACGLCGSTFVCKTRKRKDGTTYRRWYCANAAAHGRNGCTIGRTLREEQIRDMILLALEQLDLDARLYLSKKADIACWQTVFRALVDSICMRTGGKTELRLRNLKQVWIFEIN